MRGRVPLRVWIGLAFILTAVCIYGSWKWWMETRTWVPLDIPISLAPGHVLSPEFRVNVDAGFWIFIEEWRAFDADAADCLIGYGEEYCRKSQARPLRASWKLMDSGKIVAQGSTDSYQAWRGGMVSRARGLGAFSVPPGRHYVLDINIIEGGRRFDAGHPRLWIAPISYWLFEQDQTLVFLFSLFFGAVGTVLLAIGIWQRLRDKREAERVSLTAPGPLPGDLVFEVGSAEQLTSITSVRTPMPSVWLGLALVVLGAATFGSVRHWCNTRIRVPVDVPVSLASGHIRTGPFQLNLATKYWIAVDAGDWWRVGRNCTDSYPNLMTRWVLYQDGKVVDREDDPRHDDGPNRFEAKPGTYEADVEVLSDFKCLDSGHPRLTISAITEDYDTWVFDLKTAAAACAFIGIVLLAFLPAVRFACSFEHRDSDSASAIIASNSVEQNFQWARTLPLRRPISGLPNFGMIAAIVFSILVMMMMLLGPVTPKGLWVHLLKPGQVPAKSDQWTQPLIVRLEDAGPGREPKMFVNSKQVGWDGLAPVIKSELSRQSEWTLYVEGDDCIAWANVAAVVDTARGLHAKVFLDTDTKRKPCQWPMGLPVTR